LVIFIKDCCGFQVTLAQDIHGAQCCLFHHAAKQQNFVQQVMDLSR
jgi:hypothetical protein